MKKNYQNHQTNYIFTRVLPKFSQIHNNYLKSNLMIKPIISYQQSQNIKQAIQQSQFQYDSFFLFDKIYSDFQQNQKDKKDNKNHETQQVPEIVEKKGFQYCQYQANNPIQDSIVSFQIPELNAYVVSIFDGHGGPDLAIYSAKNIANILQNFIKIRMKMPKYQKKQIQLIKQALNSVHSELQNLYYEIYCRQLTNQKKRYKGVGTCAITLVLLQDKFIIATCGDSQAILIQDNQDSMNFKKLSEKYSVNNKAERQRLFNQYQSIDKNIIIEERKNVFYLKGVLQPTKSIGDYYLKMKQHYFCEGQFKGPYLNCQPDIKVFDIKQDDRYILMASDGLWDYLTKWQILNCFMDRKKQKKSISERETESENQDQIETEKQISTPTYLCEKVLQKVSNQVDVDINFLKSLQSGSRRSYHDDITICLIDLKQFFGNETKKN